MSLLTFAEAKASRLQDIAQACSSSSEFASLLNEATQALMTRGDWAGLVVPIHVCVQNGCVTWPRYVGKVRRINACGNEVKIGNLREAYNNWGNSWGWGDTGWLGDGSLGNWSGMGGGRMTNQGRYPTYKDLNPLNLRLIRAYPSVQQDIGQTITIFGLDNNRQPLMTQDPVSGNWSQGITITLAVPFGSTSVYVSQIDRISKSVTQGLVRLYAYDATNNVLEDLAVYEPTETDPNYERDKIHTTSIRNCNGGCTTSVAALVKLQFVPVVADTDLVLISNIRALKFAVQAIKLEEANQDEAASIKMAKAVKELNLELEDQYPLDQTPVDTGFMGGSYIGSQKCI